MKKNILGIIIIIIGISIIFPVKASNKSLAITLDCPSSANGNDTITCNVYANISGSNYATISNIDITTNNYIKSKKTTLNKGETITNGEIGQVTLNLNESGGTAKVTINITVSFEIGGSVSATDQSYIVVTSSVNTLNSIKIDDSIVPDFNKNKTSYNITTSAKKVNIQATKTSSKSTIKGSGEKTLKCGNNISKITVTSQSKKQKVYTLNITRSCNENTYLNGINLSQGTLSPEFNKDVYEYNVELDKKVETISIKGIKSDKNQTISGEIENKKIDFGTTKVNLVVTSQTGKKKTYVININKKDTRSSSNSLSLLSLSDGNISFSPDVLDYEIKVLYQTKKIEIIATPESEEAKVQIKGNDNLQVGENLIVITVTSEKNEKKQYKIKVTRLKEGETLGTNANIANIIVKDYNLPFEYKRNDYKLVIKDEEKLNINVIMDDSNATYEIIGNENLKDGSVIKINTKSQDGTTKTYTITITKANNTIYYIIAIILFLLVITIPIIVYFRLVRNKKGNVDINGYKINTKEDVYQERKVIKSKNINKINNNKKITNETKNNNKEKPKEEDFDAGLQDYKPNISSNKCPACGRELLGNPNECPYCKTSLK